MYLAGRYSRLKELAGYAKDITGLGYVVTANWLAGEEEGKSEMDVAKMDRDDIVRTHWCVGFTDPPGSMNSGGGRHWEMGYAYATNKRCYIVGPREIVFHHLPEIKQFDNFSLFLDWLTVMKPGA